MAQELPSYIEDLGDDEQHRCRLQLYATPRASRTKIVGLHDDRLKVQVAAPPVDGAANEAIIAFFAQRLGVSKSSVRLTAGLTGKRKTLEVDHIDAVSALALLELTLA